jgi:hypothetical protein
MNTYVVCIRSFIHHCARVLLSSRISIINTNDAPIISLDGRDPVITRLSLNYIEGSRNVLVAPNLEIVVVDPQPIIRR